MDGVSDIAGVAAIIDISAKIASRCFAYSVAVKNAKKDIDRLQRTVIDIMTVLREVDQLLKVHGTTQLSTTDKLSDSLEACLEQLRELNTRLKPRKAHRAMHRLGFQALSWPFTSEQVEVMIRSLQNFQQTFSLAILTDQTTLILGCNQKLSRVDKNTDRLLLKLNLPNLPFAEGASFDSHREEHNSKCLANTRVDLLHRIEEWAKDKNGKPIFWLKGMAGTGKSTIARTVAQSFFNSGQLGGSFFFKKGEGDRGNAARFFSTLARHLAARIPEMESGIRKAVDAEPTISEKTLLLQFEKLILQPLSQACHILSRDMTLIIVVDALDECDNDRDIQKLLELLSRFQEPQPVTLRLFVTSRPELPIRLGFKQMSDGTFQDLILHEVNSHIIRHDIEAYFQHQLRTIREQRSLHADWPTSDQIQALVDMAVPLFISAATACRYIGDERDNPKKRLDDILAYQTEPDVTQLDRIYLPILKKLFLDDESNKRGRQRRASDFRNVVGTIVTLESPLSILSLARLLGVPEEDVCCQLDSLHSVLGIPVERNMPVTLLHLSFRDFLHDPGRGKDSPFYVDEIQVHRNLAEQCIHLMSASLRQDICGANAPGALVTDVGSSQIQQCLPAELQYACLYWVQHLQKGGSVLYDEDPVHLFLKKHLLHWLEALSWMRRVFEGFNTIKTLQSIIENHNCPGLRHYTYDIRRFVLYHRSTIEQAPLQTYYSTLVFSPTMSLVRKQFENHFPKGMKKLPDEQKNWSASLQTQVGYTGGASAVAFLPDGITVASGSADGTVRLWDAATDTVRQTLEGHTGIIWAVTFSPDRMTVASGADDHTVRLWDTATGMARQTFKGHTEWVLAIAFSPDGMTVASGSSDRTVRLWDVTTGIVRQTLKGHTDWIIAVVFSPDGKTVASGSADRTVRLWGVATGTIRLTLKGHTDWVITVAFSPDGTIVASGSNDQTVKLWDVVTGIAQQTLKGHTNWVKAIAFTPDGTMIASGSNDHTVRLWDLVTGITRTLEGHTNWIKAVVFSLDGITVASESDDGTIRLWDTAKGTTQKTLEGYTCWVRAIAFSPNGTIVASGSDDRIVRLWDAATGLVRQTLKGHTSRINTVVFSPDGTMVASGSADRTVRLWDVATGAPWKELDAHAIVTELSFSGDGAFLLTNRGRLPVTNSIPAVVPLQENHFQDIVVEEQWVIVRRERMLWLPFGYRASCVAVCGSVVALGHRSGRISIIKFDFSE